VSQKKNIKAKKAAIRKEIKERMQAELDDRKREIKSRIKHEDISLEEKREKYRQEAHEEKLQLMERAKEEFRARKRMLGLNTEEEPEADAEEEPYAVSYEEEEIPQEDQANEQFEILEEDDDLIDAGKYRPPGEAFIYTDDEEEDQRRQYEAPISEGDIAPLGFEAEEERPVQPEAGPEPDLPQQSIFYYIFNLIPHPVQTLDELDEYMAAPSGLIKLGLFYVISLLPVILFGMAGDAIGEYMPRGVVGAAVDSIASQGMGPFMLVGQTILNLLIFTLSITVVNYLVTSQANFFTLIIYFGFVEAVTRLVTYTFILMAVFGVIAITVQPELIGIIGGVAILLLLAFVIWTFALNMIVLMSAYDYSLFIAFVLAFAANMVRSIISHIAVAELGFSSF
jgi:hypothetical protein